MTLSGRYRLHGESAWSDGQRVDELPAWTHRPDLDLGLAVRQVDPALVERMLQQHRVGLDQYATRREEALAAGVKVPPIPSAAALVKYAERLRALEASPPPDAAAIDADYRARMRLALDKGGLDAARHVWAEWRDDARFGVARRHHDELQDARRRLGLLGPLGPEPPRSTRRAFLLEVDAMTGGGILEALRVAGR